MPDTKLRVMNIEILTGGPDEGVIMDTFLKFELEDGRSFIMSSIPTDIALEIHQYIHEIPNPDSRYRLSTLINEIAMINKVVIDSVVPMTQAYQATLELTLEGVSRTLQFPMIPSHATLLASVAGAPIYVSKELVDSFERSRNP